MGSAQSYISGVAVAAFVAAGVAVAAYGYTSHSPQSPSAGAIAEPAPPTASSKKKSKKKQTGAQAEKPVETAAASPSVVPFPPVVPGDFDASSEQKTADPVVSTKPTKKKKKAKKATPSTGSGSRAVSVDTLSESSATAPESYTPAPARPTTSKRKSSTPKPPVVDTDGSWTRVEPHSSRQHPSVESATGDAGVTTTSVTGNSSPVAERTDDDLSSPVVASSGNRRTLAERLLPKPRKTGVDDMLETPDYPTLSRVMRIQPGPNDKPAAGFSWGDYEDVDESRGTADDADGEDDGGWGVVKGRSRKTSKPAPTLSVPETVTKKQRQNAAKRDAQKAARADADAEREARLAKHKRELERARIAEQYGKTSKAMSGGMTAYVDENGKLVWK
ncbi:uncharacterized protein FIBRA_02772 [Fibroporia radiculosa]|uniref:Uncharacterized protein n=1 Tax=Fibroporia radiculosa TaxID=599839 RepID=J4HVG8_9APHY|nr:uncharacterized protein FIBRA_02772 [Fibroporia radiculosa]CCM00732.1 predicted protein [Fibroporia radiculosa]